MILKSAIARILNTVGQRRVIVKNSTLFDPVTFLSIVKNAAALQYIAEILRPHGARQERRLLSAPASA